MPKGVYIKTKEHKERIRIAHVGKKHPHTKETIEKIRLSNIGKKRSIESRKKMSISHLGKVGYWLGKKRPEITGVKHPRWKGGYENTLRICRIYKARKRHNIFGTHNQDEWDKLKIKYNFTCPRCHKKEPKIKLTEDHIIPLSKGGSNGIKNIQPLCKKCNCKKRDKTIKYSFNKKA